MKSGILGLIVGLLLGSIFTWSYIDYQAWVGLGKGGLPSNIGGWFKVTSYRFKGGDPLDMGGFEADIGKSWDVVTLDTLDIRSGTKPNIAPQPVPHRQLTQIGNDPTRQLISDRVEQIFKDNPELLSYEISHTEKHNKALWAADRDSINPHSGNRGEIAHVHPSNGSVHVILSPSDAKTAMQARWGELHPLSSAGLMGSNTYILIYSPRTAEEVDAVEEIIKASVMYTTGVMPK